MCLHIVTKNCGSIDQMKVKNEVECLWTGNSLKINADELIWMPFFMHPIEAIVHCKGKHVDIDN